MHPQIALLVKVELQKLLDVGLITPIYYLEWVSNMVPISKPTGGIRIYIGFKDLNKACLKYGFPLPNIDMIAVLTIGHKIISLMDGFSKYNQIRIVEDDQHKKYSLSLGEILLECNAIQSKECRIYIPKRNYYHIP